MTRAVAIAVALAAVALTACGGGGGDSASPKTPSTASTTNGAGTTTSQAPRAKRKPSGGEPGVAAPKPGTPPSTGRRQAAYLKAKAACGSEGAAGIARRYGLRARNPSIVARLYSQRAFAPPAQGAAFAGCVDGFR